MQHQYNISEDRILQIANNIAEDELDCFTKKELIEVVRYYMDTLEMVRIERQIKDSDKVLAAMKAFESFQMKQYRLPRGRKPNCVKEFLKANHDIPSFSLICEQHNRWYSHIDNLAPYHFEASKCSKCQNFKSKTPLKQLMTDIKETINPL